MPGVGKNNRGKMKSFYSAYDNFLNSSFARVIVGLFELSIN